MDDQEIMTLVFAENGLVITDSLMVAKVFKKQHRNVVADIENQIGKLDEAGEGEWGMLNFQHTQYQNPQNHQWYPKYNMTIGLFANILLVAADRSNQLRVCDVDRVMDEAVQAGQLEGFRAWLLGQELQARVRTEVENWVQE